jgi:hypothetical protein
MPSKPASGTRKAEKFKDGQKKSLATLAPAEPARRSQDVQKGQSRERSDHANQVRHQRHLVHLEVSDVKVDSPSMLDESAAAKSEGSVWTYRSRQNLRRDHEIASIVEIAKRIGKLKDVPYAGECQLDSLPVGPSYIVPDETLSSETAACLGIGGERDIFGGIVPHEFVATKIITHPLVNGGATSPDAFSRELGEEIKPAVLRGYAVFSQTDARSAGAALLVGGPLRIKPSREKGGLGQIVVTNQDELCEQLAQCDLAEMAKFGLVLEENLLSMETCSVGFVSIGEMSIAYYGTQTLTPNNHQGIMYGGSNLFAVRGGPESLLEALSSNRQRLAVEQALAYDVAVRRWYKGVIASRRNYDVAQGIDAQGNWKSGVLEQSWRVGGASPAEIMAFETFKNEPGREFVRVCCVERYSEDTEIPENGQVYYQGVDDHAGPLTKYALVLP